MIFNIPVMLTLINTDKQINNSRGKILINFTSKKPLNLNHEIIIAAVFKDLNAGC